MDTSTYELTKGSEILIESELGKILKIEKFLLEEGVSENDVKQYALAIYNRSGGRIDVIDRNVERVLAEKMIRDGSVNKQVEEISRKHVGCE